MEFNINGEDLINKYSNEIARLTREKIMLEIQLEKALVEIEEQKRIAKESQDRMAYAEEELHKLNN